MTTVAPFHGGHIPDDPYAFGYFTQATIVITTRPTWVLFGKTLVGVTYIFRSGGREFGIVPARVVDVATNT
jgi:hypothetical protein